MSLECILGLIGPLIQTFAKQIRISIRMNFEEKFYFSGLMSAGAMGLWHGVEYFEKEKVNDGHNDVELFVKSWDPLLREYTNFRYDWSYIVAWVGVGMCLASASLFAMAGFCIKGDREHEEAMNMQYLMPVYPQKGQPYGPYGYAAYPGPAAYYGSQYGLPYSQY